MRVYYIIVVRLYKINIPNIPHKRRLYKKLFLFVYIVFQKKKKGNLRIYTVE
jgi:hypothetical protein